MNIPTTASRNPWPIAIVSFFIVFITVVVAFILWSTRQRMDLVRADYYDEEIKFQEQLDRLNRTKPINAQVVIGYDSMQDVITINLPAATAKHDPSGSIQLYRPSDAHLDHRIRLAADANGAQRIDARKLRPGLWKVRVQWVVDGQEYFFDQPVIVGSHPS